MPAQIIHFPTTRDDGEIAPLEKAVAELEQRLITRALLTRERLDLQSLAPVRSEE